MESTTDLLFTALAVGRNARRPVDRDTDRQEQSPMILAIPHAANGRRCVCGRPVFLTPGGWRDRDGRGTHLEPKPR